MEKQQHMLLSFWVSLQDPIDTGWHNDLLWWQFLQRQHWGLLCQWHLWNRLCHLQTRHFSEIQKVARKQILIC